MPGAIPFTVPIIRQLSSGRVLLAGMGRLERDEGAAAALSPPPADCAIDRAALLLPLIAPSRALPF